VEYATTYGIFTAGGVAAAAAAAAAAASVVVFLQHKHPSTGQQRLGVELAS